MNPGDARIENASGGSHDCGQAGELLAESWQGALPASTQVWLKNHLESCAACADVDRTWRALGELPQVAPDPAQRQRFERMLAAYQAGASAPLAKPAAPARRWSRVFDLSAWRGDGSARRGFGFGPAWVAALLCLAAGLGGGWWLRGARPAPAAAVATDQAKEIAALRQEVHTTGQLVVLSLLQQQSASERLRGVNWSYRLSNPDPQVTSALVGSLNNDPSPDVRLAALEALQQIAQPNQPSPLAPEVRQELVESFQHQKSPLVQIALVDSFVDTHDTEARALLEAVRAGTQYNPEVRQRAEWGLMQWN